MEWIQAAILTTAEGIEPVCGRLMTIGINGFEIEDKEDFLTFLEENRAAWDYVDEDLMREKSKDETRVKLYVTQNAAGHEQLSMVRDALAALKETDTDDLFGALTLELNTLQEEDWAENWKQYFHPLKVGDKILIQPEWEPISEETDRVVFTINPGMSFGTGSHHTTQLCIEAIERYIKPEATVLDLGCGSGILSIIARLLGAGDTVAMDIDPNAVDIALENAKKNRVDRYTAFAGNILTDTKLQMQFSEKRFDLVVANIVADVIIPLAPLAKNFIKDDGVFVASGIILPRLDEVRGALEENFRIVSVHEKNDWGAVVCRKK